MKGASRRGPQDSATIVFLHGGVINRHMWDPVVDHLADRFDCLSLDIPGHGDLTDQSFTTDDSVNTLVSSLRHMDIESATLVGLSLGGYVAQAAAAKQPHRVDGLVISGATIKYLGWDGVSTKLYGVIFPLLARPAMKTFGRKMTEDLGRELADKILEGGLSARGGAQALRRLPGTDYAKEMAGYRGPIVIANGERDSANRDGEAAFIELFPQTQSIVIEDAGHACALQQPQAFASAIDQLMVRVS